AWARETAAADLEAFPFPAYVLDFTTRLVAWNRRVAPLFGLSPGDPRPRDAAPAAAGLERPGLLSRRLRTLHPRRALPHDPLLSRRPAHNGTLHELARRLVGGPPGGGFQAGPCTHSLPRRLPSH